jgi:hypothetical protein
VTYPINPGKFKSVEEISRTDLKKCIGSEDGYSEYGDEGSEDEGEASEEEDKMGEI